VNDSAYHVPTEITAEMDGLLGRLAGGSIGVAGPRGSGKSTLVRGYCEDPGYGSGDLRCMVAAPVDYVARDFILHLFATFCRCVRAQAAVRGTTRTMSRRSHDGSPRCRDRC
jgi:ABC-type Mn2+/Zn2+ transport system ATPase subunit